VGTGQFSLNDYLSSKNEFNPDLAESISEEVRNQLLQQIHEEAESAVLSCKNPTNQFLATICLMCKVSDREIFHFLKNFDKGRESIFIDLRKLVYSWS